MSNFYYGSQHHSSNSHLSHSHHGGRSRRSTRASAAQHNNHHKQMRALRLQKEAEETAMEKAWAFRRDFEAARSFDLEDDEIFCPFNLLTEDDLQSIPSGSDRSSLSSGSPEHSPLQQQIQPTPVFMLPPSSAFPSSFPSQSSSNSTSMSTSTSTSTSNQTKLHQPLAQRMGGKAIPIVDPSTGTVASPPPSVSPARQLVQAQQFVSSSRRAW